MTEALVEPLTELALFELLSLECRTYSDGTLRYYNSLDQVHRVHGPAVEWADGTHMWYQNGRRHRLGGPAVEYSDGNRVWYQNGQMHREHGPAVEYSDGDRVWYQNGQRHRIDGPAVEYPDGGRAWYINGKALTEAEWQQAVASMENV